MTHDTRNNKALSTLRPAGLSVRAALMAAFALTVSTASPALAGQFGGFAFEQNDIGAIVTGYEGPGGEIVIPSSVEGVAVTSIGYHAFAGNTEITSVTIPDGVIWISEYAFDGCVSLAEAAIPKSVETLAESAFLNCSGLRSIDVDPQNPRFRSVGGVLYEGVGSDFDRVRLILCPARQSGPLDIGPDVTELGDVALPGNSSLLAINVAPQNGSFRSIDGVLFSKDGRRLIRFPCGREGIFRIPEGVEWHDRAFVGCEKLTEVTIPAGVTTISDSEFDGCVSLREVTIPKSVGSMASGAFANCIRLQSINVDPLNPAFRSVGGVLYRGNDDEFAQVYLSFCPAQNTEHLDLAANVVAVEYGAFPPHSRLVTIHVDPGNEHYRSADGVLFTKDGRDLIRYPCARTGSYRIPVDVEGLHYQAFAGADSLVSVVIPDSVKRLVGWTFSGCSRLRYVVVGSDIGWIGTAEFGSCPNLGAVYFRGDAPPLDIEFIGFGVLNTPAGAARISRECGGEGYYGGGGGFLWHEDPFLGSPLVKTYHLQGAPGQLYGDRPAADWAPRMELMPGNDQATMIFDIVWPGGEELVVEASPSLAMPDWKPLETVTAADEGVHFEDPTGSLVESRFYRLVRP